MDLAAYPQHTTAPGDRHLPVHPSYTPLTNRHAWQDAAVLCLGLNGANYGLITRVGYVHNWEAAFFSLSLFLELVAVITLLHLPTATALAGMLIANQACLRHSGCCKCWSSVSRVSQWYGTRNRQEMFIESVSPAATRKLPMRAASSAARHHLPSHSPSFSPPFFSRRHQQGR